MKKLLKLVALVAALAMAVGATEGWAGTAKRSPKQVTGVINLNTATPAQLDLLPGVGEKAAQRILEHRKKTPFTRPEDLVKVKGFGKKKYDRLKAHLAVSGATTLAPKADSGEAPAQARAAPARR